MKRAKVYGRLHFLGASKFIAAVCCVLGAASIFVVSRRYGLGVSIDGVIYLTAARQILEGHGVSDLVGSPLTLFPPLFPLLLAAIEPLVSSVESASRILQMALYAGNYLLAATLLARYVQHRLLLPAFLVLLLVSRTLLLYHYYVLTEPLYVFLTLGMLLVLARWIEEQKTGLIIAAALLAALSCLTRYVGVANVLTGVFVIAGSRGKQWTDRAKDGALFAALAGIPLLVWLARNSLVGDAITGERLPSPYPLLLNLELAADSIALWFVPDEIQPAARVMLVVATMLVCGLILLRMKRSATSPLPQLPGLLAGVILAHLLVLIMATTFFAIDHINTRFVMPVFIPCVILIALSMSWIVQRRRSARPFVFAVLAIWILVQGVGAARSILAREQNGVGGFATRGWQESKVMDYVRRNRDSLGTDLYSNSDYGVFFWTGIVVRFLPDRLNPRWKNDYPRQALANRESMDDLLSLVDRPDRSVTLIWFDSAKPDPGYESIYVFNLYDLEEIKALFWVAPRFEAEDGGVFQLKARTPHVSDSSGVVLGDPKDIDFSQVSGFIIEGKTSGKVFLRALNKSGVEFGQAFAVDESEVGVEENRSTQDLTIYNFPASYPQKSRSGR